MGKLYFFLFFFPMSPSSSSSTKELLYFLGVGQIKGEGENILLCYSTSTSFTNETNNFKSECKKVMDKGGNKFVPGRRVRLTREDKTYDLHLLPEEKEGNIKLVFFVLASPDFTTYYSITSLFKDFRTRFYEQGFLSEIIKEEKEKENNKSISLSSLFLHSYTSRPLQTSTQPFFKNLLETYNKSTLLEVEQKVEDIKVVMKQNIDNSLQQLELLNGMEQKGEELEKSARDFEKGATKLSRLQKCRYYKLQVLVVFIIILILTLLIYFLSRGT